MKPREFYDSNKEKFIEAFGISFFHDVITIGMIIISLLILLTIFLVISFKIKPTETLLPLSYNSTFGVTQLGAWYKLYFYPLVYFVFSLINILIAWSFFEKERLITYLTLFIHLIIGFLLTIVVYNLTVLAA